MIKTYRESPREVEAVKFENTSDCLMTISGWLRVSAGVKEDDPDQLILLLNGEEYPINHGDYLVKFTEELLAIIKAEEFHQAYDRVIKV